MGIEGALGLGVVGVVLGAADALNVELVVKVVKVKGEGGIEGGRVRNAAAGARDRLLGVTAKIGGVMAEGSERVGLDARRGEAGAMGGGGGTAEEFLPPGSVVGVVGIRSGGIDAEGLEEGVEPAFVSTSLLRAETEEEKEDVGE